MRTTKVITEDEYMSELIRKAIRYLENLEKELSSYERESEIKNYLNGKEAVIIIEILQED